MHNFSSLTYLYTIFCNVYLEPNFLRLLMVFCLLIMAKGGSRSRTLVNNHPNWNDLFDLLLNIVHLTTKHVYNLIIVNMQSLQYVFYSLFSLQTHSLRVYKKGHQNNPQTPRILPFPLVLKFLDLPLFLQVITLSWRFFFVKVAGSTCMLGCWLCGNHCYNLEMNSSLLSAKKLPPKIVQINKKKNASLHDGISTHY